MQVNISVRNKFAFPSELIREHFSSRLPRDFCQLLGEGSGFSWSADHAKSPTLYTAHLPKVLDWLHSLDYPKILQEKPCITPLILYDKMLSTEKLLFHYEGNQKSAKLIRCFVDLFGANIKESSAVIISPSFIPKSKMKEEQELVQLVSNATKETSFIKFNFNRIGDFWSYAVKNRCTLLVTTKEYQAELAKVLFHFYKGGMWYDGLSFYLAI